MEEVLLKIYHRKVNAKSGRNMGWDGVGWGKTETRVVITVPRSRCNRQMKA